MPMQGVAWPDCRLLRSARSPFALLWGTCLSLANLFLPMLGAATFPIFPQAARGAHVAFRFLHWLPTSALADRMHELRGKRLACDCQPNELCHETSWWEPSACSSVPAALRALPAVRAVEPVVFYLQQPLACKFLLVLPKPPWSLPPTLSALGPPLSPCAGPIWRT